MKKSILTIGLLILVQTLTFGKNNSSDEMLDKARQMYYKATDNEEHLEPAIELFIELEKADESYEGVAKTYIGSLTALKGYYAFWPQDKWKLANKGIDIMKRGIEQSPENLEALFIYGTTCYHLPFFFGMAEEAEEKLKRIITLSNENSISQYDSGIIKNALIFIRDNIDLTKSETNKTKELIKIITKT